MGRLVQQTFDMLTNWRFVLPFALNQCGSAVYMAVIGTSELSMAVVLCQTFTFVFTTLTSYALGEPNITPRTALGFGLISCGVALCITSKGVTPV
jgi:drug/metabolite transporter (DMT)-like permease